MRSYRSCSFSRRDRCTGRKHPTTSPRSWYLRATSPATSSPPPGRHSPPSSNRTQADQPMGYESQPNPSPHRGPTRHIPGMDTLRTPRKHLPRVTSSHTTTLRHNDLQSLDTRTHATTARTRQNKNRNDKTNLRYAKLLNKGTAALINVPQPNYTTGATPQLHPPTHREETLTLPSLTNMKTSSWCQSAQL